MDFNVATYNVFAPVEEPIRFYGQKERMSKIPPAFQHFIDHQYQVDVVVVQESIVPKQHKILSDGMRTIGYIYETRPLQLGIQKLKFVRGGVVIFSKHPIITQDDHVYHCGCFGADCLAAKGFVYAKICKQGRYFHVLGTHLQAWETPEAREIRHKQIMAMQDFIDKLHTEKDEPIIIAGDFNFDMYSQPLQFQRMQNTLQVSMPPIHPDSQLFSADPRINSLVGNDADTGYESVYYRKGCYEEYQRNLRCPCCPTELLDYVFVAKKGLQPLKNTLRIIPLQAMSEFIMSFNATIKRTTRELSDHYPVLAQLRFDLIPKEVEGLNFHHEPLYERHNSWLSSVVGFIAVMLIFGTLLCIYFD